MKKLFVTGGTAFISKYIAKYYVEKNFDVYVLNRKGRRDEFTVFSCWKYPRLIQGFNLESLIVLFCLLVAVGVFIAFANKQKPKPLR